jgi:hypothetical protein
MNNEQISNTPCLLCRTKITSLENKDFGADVRTVVSSASICAADFN